MATRTSLKDEELVSDPWPFKSPLAYGPVNISVAKLTGNSEVLGTLC